ncbi:unnamed protein product [Lathyrus sativus]|nr:unnamed protein product [Lathyrus sativus]
MASDNPSADNGFTRSEMYSKNLAGTVDAYDRHIFLCYEDPLSWPSNLEEFDTHHLPAIFDSTLKCRQKDIPAKTKFTVCEAREEDGFSNGDVFIFPDMIKYRGVLDPMVGFFFKDVMVDGKPWSFGATENFTGSYVYVCAHGSRDARCGTCGPALIKKFNKEIELRGLKDQITVTACSHIGGHKYAGNVIIFSPGPDGKTTGHWYGYVTPNDVPDLLDQHIAKGEVIHQLWRGQMGAPGATRASKKKKEKDSRYCRSACGASCCSYKRQNNQNWPTLESNVLTVVGVLGAVAAVTVAYKLYRRSG